MSKYDKDYFDKDFFGDSGKKGSQRDFDNPFYHFFVARVVYCIRNIIPEEKKVETVLDLGCGMGFKVNLYLGHGFDAYGADVSKYAIENTIAPVGRCSIGDIRTFKAKNKCDLVVAERVLGYLPARDSLRAIRNIAQSSKRYVLFAIICSDHKDKDRPKYGSPGRLNINTKAWWEERFKRAGLKIHAQATKSMVGDDWDCIWWTEKEK